MLLLRSLSLPVGTIFPLLLSFPRLVLSACDSRLCVAGCGAFDARLNFCNFDHQVFSSLESCVCEQGSGDFEQNLLNCISCGNSQYGSNKFVIYQFWAVVCGTYQESGEGAAISVATAPVSVVNSFYQASIIPAVSSICPTGFTTAGSAVPSFSAASTAPDASATPPSTTSPSSNDSNEATSSASSPDTATATTVESSTSTTELPTSTTGSSASASAQSSSSTAAAAPAQIPTALMALVVGLPIGML